MTDLHLLSGSYVVDALDDLERSRFERHLATCDDCRREVASLRETSALLSSTEAVPPPPALREQVLGQIRTVRPLPPAVAADSTSPDDSANGVVRRRPRLRGLVAAAAAVLVVGGGLALGVSRPWEEPAQPTVAAQVRDADDAVRKSVRVPGGGTATVWHSAAMGKAVLVTKRMPAAPTGKVYELWLQGKDDAMVPAGLMDGGGDRTVVLDGDASGAAGVGVTMEPAGGSEQPTSDPMILINLEKSA